MGRVRRRYDNMQSSDNPDLRYDMAFQKMKKIKGFYIHLLIYILANIFFIAANQNESIGDHSLFWSFKTFSTAIFWVSALCILQQRLLSRLRQWVLKDNRCC